MARLFPASGAASAPSAAPAPAPAASAKPAAKTPAATKPAGASAAASKPAPKAPTSTKAAPAKKAASATPAAPAPPKFSENDSIIAVSRTARAVQGGSVNKEEADKMLGQANSLDAYLGWLDEQEKLSPYMERVKQISEQRKKGLIGPRQNVTGDPSYPTQGRPLKILPAAQPSYGTSPQGKKAATIYPRLEAATSTTIRPPPLPDLSGSPRQIAKIAQTHGNRFKEAVDAYDKGAEEIAKKVNDPRVPRSEIPALAKAQRERAQRVVDLAVPLGEFGWGDMSVEELIKEFRSNPQLAPTPASPTRGWGDLPREEFDKIKGY